MAKFVIFSFRLTANDIKNRADIGLRSIELRNNLLDIEKETEMNLYHPKDWQKSRIMVANKSQN